MDLFKFIFLKISVTSLNNLGSYVSNSPHPLSKESERGMKSKLFKLVINISF
jgi:hypothetical protein